MLALLDQLLQRSALLVVALQTDSSYPFAWVALAPLAPVQSALLIALQHLEYVPDELSYLENNLAHCIFAHRLGLVDECP